MFFSNWRAFVFCNGICKWRRIVFSLVQGKIVFWRSNSILRSWNHIRNWVPTSKRNNLQRFKGLVWIRSMDKKMVACCIVPYTRSKTLTFILGWDGCIFFSSRSPAKTECEGGAKLFDTVYDLITSRSLESRLHGMEGCHRDIRELELWLRPVLVFFPFP